MVSSVMTYACRVNFHSGRQSQRPAIRLQKESSAVWCIVCMIVWYSPKKKKRGCKYGERAECLSRGRESPKI